MVIDSITCFPLWRDIVLSTENTSFAAFDAVEFDLCLNGQGYPVIMTGKAQKRPGDSYISLRLNDAIAGYVRPQFGPLNVNADSGVVKYSISTPDSGMMKSFRLRWIDPDGNVATESLYFNVYNDFSYDFTGYSELGSAAYIRAPKVYAFRAGGGIIVPGQFVFVSTLTGDRVQFLDSDGTVIESITDSVSPIAPGLWYCRASVLADAIDGDSVGISVGMISGQSTWELVRMSAFTILRNACARYVLYYVDADGGWCSFVILGSAIASDAISRSEYTKQAKMELLGISGGALDRSRTILGAEIVKHLELHTHYMSDEEAAEMHNLTESVEVYVHDLQERLIYPAVLTDSTHRVKTYKNQGHKLFSYTLNLDIAVPFERR